MFDLPTLLVVNGEECPIHSDFRIALSVFNMFEDNELTTLEKRNFMVKLLYVNEPPDTGKAAEMAAWFIDGGMERHISNSTKDYGRLYSFDQDKIYIFSGVDGRLGYSSRSQEYLHWWVWLGAFMDLGECTFSHITHMRKARKDNKLTKEEQKAWRENSDLYEIHSVAQETQNFLDLINS